MKTIPFESFYNVYPRKESKGAARRVWEKLNPLTFNPPLTENEFIRKVELAIEAQIIYRRKCKKELPDWKLPATWLRAECWDDQIPSLSDQYGLNSNGENTGPNVKEDKDDWRKLCRDEYMQRSGLAKRFDETQQQYIDRMRETAREKSKQLKNLMV